MIYEAIPHIYGKKIGTLYDDSGDGLLCLCLGFLGLKFGKILNIGNMRTIRMMDREVFLELEKLVKETLQEKENYFEEQNKILKSLIHAKDKLHEKYLYHFKIK